MNPCDALQQDWRMYYDGAWMDHISRGPGQVYVSGTQLKMYFFPDGKMEAAPVKVRPSELRCWWPRSGAYNTQYGAIFVARKNTRSMRKSAHPREHYVVKWGGMNAIQDYGVMMAMLRNGPALVDIDFALRVLEEKMSGSVAVSRDIILATGETGINVIYRGIKAGVLGDGDFTADYARSAISRRVSEKLRKEGIL